MFEATGVRLSRWLHTMLGRKSWKEPESICANLLDYSSTHKLRGSSKATGTNHIAHMC
jgi:hypothetical protein